MLVSLRVFKHTEAQWWTPDVWGAAAPAVCGGAPARRKLFYIFSELDGHNHVLSAIGAAERALSQGYEIIRGSQFVAMCTLTATKSYTQVL